MMVLWTISEAAERLGVSIWALRKWADTGKVPVTRLPGGHRRWSPEQIAEIKGKMQQPAAGAR